MKKAIIVAGSGVEHQQSWGGAFAEGLRRHGWSVDVVSAAGPRCDLLAMWGARRRDRIEKQKASGGEVCVLERGYLGDRFAWTSVSFGGGLNGRGRFHGPFEDGSRFKKHFAHLMQPWRAPGSGRYALIMQQVPGDTAVRNCNLPAFYHEAQAAFAQHMPVRIRPHPNVNPSHGKELIAAARTSLAQDLANARCVVTWNSNSAVDAVMAGVPAVAMDRGSMAWAVTGHAMVMPPQPDRTAWAYAMAWKQWQLEEMRNGDCWDAINPYTRREEAVA